ncbi:hypothetical protein Tco_0080772 [Tanacetum coccineum]
MTTPVEKRNNKFYEFYGEVGHNTHECMHLKRQIKELIKAGKLSHVIKELNQGSGKDQPIATKKGEASRKDKAMAILMVQPWQKVARQRITQSFSPNSKTSFPPLGDEDGTKGPMIIKAKIGGDAEHSTSAWMNFAVVRSPSSYSGIIGRPGIRKIQAIPSTTHGMLKFPVSGGIVTLRCSRIIPLECTMVSGLEAQTSDVKRVAEEKIKVEIHPEYPDQTIAIGSSLTEEGRKALCELLRRNLEIFAWKPEDMTGVP